MLVERSSDFLALSFAFVFFRPASAISLMNWLCNSCRYKLLLDGIHIQIFDSWVHEVHSPQWRPITVGRVESPELSRWRVLWFYEQFVISGSSLSKVLYTPQLTDSAVFASRKEKGNSLSTVVSARSYTFGRSNAGRESSLAQESESIPHHQIPKKINSSENVLWPADY